MLLFVLAFIFFYCLSLAFLVRFFGYIHQVDEDMEKMMTEEITSSSSLKLL